MFGIVQRVQVIVKRGVHVVSSVISRWTKPITYSSAFGAVVDLARSKPQLVAEHLLLRQQLIVLNRSIERPRFTSLDRALFVLFACRLQRWKEAILIIKPETVLRWHRQGFRLVWKKKSRATSPAPKLPAETITLITEMATNNQHAQGAPGIGAHLSPSGRSASSRSAGCIGDEIAVVEPGGEEPRAN